MYMDRIVFTFRLLEVSPSKARSRRGGINLSPAAIVLVVFIFFISLAQAQTRGALQITSPANGTHVEGRMVMIQFELSSGVSANGIPAFRVQLDRQSPVLITDTEYVLYWLSPGWHTWAVSLVDANGTPIFNAHDQVQFEVIADPESAALDPFSFSIADGYPARDNEVPRAAASRNAKHWRETFLTDAEALL